MSGNDILLQSMTKRDSSRFHSPQPVSEARARIMSAIRWRGNRTTELAVARLLRRWKLSGWRRHQGLPGRPDFLWRGHRVALFVDGCFWHGCPRCYKAPKRNAAFWRAKILSNRTRDRRVNCDLRQLGWKVIRVWECQIHFRAFKERLCKALAHTPD